MDNQKLVNEAKKVLSREDVTCLIGYGKESTGFRVSGSVAPRQIARGARPSLPQ